MRLPVLLLLAAAAASWAGCRQRPQDAGTHARTPAAVPAPQLSGSYEATSTTAMGITGDLRVAPARLTFALDLAYETETAGAVAAATDYGKSADSWANLLGVPSDAAVEIRRVTKETVGANAPNGGLCAPDAVTFVALAAGSDEGETGVLRLAAFKGAAAPGPEASAADLCGTFNYIPKR